MADWLVLPHGVFEILKLPDIDVVEMMHVCQCSIDTRWSDGYTIMSTAYTVTVAGCSYAQAVAIWAKKGMHVFVATSAGGDTCTLTASMLQDRPEMNQQAVLTFDALQRHGTLCGDTSYNIMLLCANCDVRQ